MTDLHGRGSFIDIALIEHGPQRATRSSGIDAFQSAVWANRLHRWEELYNGSQKREGLTDAAEIATRGDDSRRRAG
jgi:hypothetical protein